MSDIASVSITFRPSNTTTVGVLLPRLRVKWCYEEFGHNVCFHFTRRGKKGNLELNLSEEFEALVVSNFNLLFSSDMSKDR